MAAENSIEPIAIIGLSSLFAGDATDTEKLWEVLLQGRSSPSPFLNNKHYHPDQARQGAIHAKAAYFLKDDSTAFDSAFFGLTKKEVLSMDPQQRVLLENAYHALENAGIPLHEAIGSKTSVFVGQCGEDFGAMCNSDMELAPTYKETGVERSIRANRISWFYDFKGASYVVDTACSSSLVALYTACQDLLLRDSEMALVSGISLIDHPSQFMGLDKLGAIGPDGLCYAFDSRANGYARGEGVGTVLLKRLSSAIADGNPIRAVIRSASAGSNGRTPGIFNPSVDAQAALINSTYKKAGLDPNVTSFIEAHGTGTKAGDAAEVKALSSAFDTPKRDTPLIVGAVKATLGHTEGAAGILGVIKVVKILETGIIPPNCNFITPNPNIDPKRLNIRFPLEAIPWPNPGIRRASINSFGFGGANSHVVIDDALSYLSDHSLHGSHYTVRDNPSYQQVRLLRDSFEESISEKESTASPDEAPNNNGLSHTLLNGELTHKTNGIHNGLSNGLSHAHSNGHSDDLSNGFFNGSSSRESNGLSNGHYEAHVDGEEQEKKMLFVVSAFDKKGLSRMGQSYQDWSRNQLARNGERRDPHLLSNIAYTLSQCRSAFNWRGYIVAGRLDEVADRIHHLKPSQVRSQSSNLCFVFTGQGAQWSGMIGALSQFAAYRESIEHAAACFRNFGSRWNLTDLLDEKVTLDPDDLTLTLPLMTVLQVAIVDLLSSWNIRPRCVIGHSSGEIAAAYASGKLGRRAALRTAYVRGVVAAKISGQKGGMLAVGLSPTKASEFIREYEASGKLTIACYNSPSNQTISGDVDAVDTIKTTLDKEGIFARKLNVANAYHSAHMLAGAEEYTALLSDLKTDDKLPGSSEVTMISTVTGLPLTSKQAESASYWTKNLVSPVKFTTALLAICEDMGVAFDDLVEIGPHSTLQSAIKETLQNSISQAHSYHATMKRKDVSAAPILEMAGALWCRGYPVQLEVLNEVQAASARILIDLPQYQFNHETSFLLESRLSSNYRFRQHPRMDLIGAPVPDWDPDHPKWRHFFRVKEIPWLAEHKISGQIISAGAGWIIMATEGIKQLADPNLSISGFRLREIALQTALIIPETDEGVEVMMHMQWMPETSHTNSNTWRDFTISSHDPETGTWRVLAKGLISIEYEQHATSIDNDSKRQAEDEAAKRQLDHATKVCRKELDSAWVYDMYKEGGFDFKRRYRNLTDISISDGQDLFDVVGVVRNPDLTSVTAAGYVYPHTFHTTALDSVLHMGLPTILARQKEGSAPPATIPSWFDEVWISSKISSRADDGLRLCLNQYNDFWYGLRNDIIGFDEHTSERRLHIKGLKYHSLQSRQLSSSVLGSCHQIKWQPDIDLVPSDYFMSRIVTSDEARDIYTSTLLTSENCDVRKATRESYNKGDLPKLLTSYLKLLKHKRGSLKILEVGPGGGIMTGTILKELTSQGEEVLASTSFVSRYVFADHANDASDELREILDTKGQEIQYQSFDLKRDPASRLLDRGSYDLIVAANVSHCTMALAATLEKLRACLDSGGKVLLLEQIQKKALSDPKRWSNKEALVGNGSLLGAEAWDVMLRQTGFTGTDVILNDKRGEACSMSIMVSTATADMGGDHRSANSLDGLVVNFLGPQHSDFCHVIAAGVAKSMGGDKLPVTTLNLVKELDVSKRTCIVLSGGNDMSMKDLDDKTFASLKHLLTSSPRILWISTDASEPYQAMVNGLLRTARWEKGGSDTDFSHFAMTPTSVDEHSIAHVFRLLGYHFSGRAVPNSEYRLRDGLIWTNRISVYQEVNDFCEAHALQDSKITLSPFRNKSDRSLKLKCRTPGLLETLYFVDDLDAKEPPAFDEIEMKVAAAGLNFRDVVVALGQQHEDVYGLEGSGIVTRVGSGVTTIKIGDRVVGIWNRRRGYMRSVCKVSHAMVAKIPDQVSFETAAAIPINMTTVLYCLRDLAHLLSGDKILIHSGAGGTGQSAIQYAQMVGAEVFTTVSTEEKKQSLVETYGIRADHVFSSRTLDFATLIMDATGGRGVDVVVNSLAGEALRRSLDCVAPLGRFIELGKKDVYSNGRLHMKAFRKSITFFAVDMLSVFEHREVYSGQLLKEAMDLVKQGSIKVPAPLETHSIADMLPAFRKLQTGNTMGKIVIRMSDDDKVPATADPPKPFSLRGDCSYLIAGGLGGVGKATAQWMVAHGARNLILISRSGIRTPEARAFITTLRDAGCQVLADACNIADENSLCRLLENCKSMPPIRGCIQSAMQLRDKSLSSMTYEDWIAAVRPKVNGSWNLHTFLPVELDFFVMLSSISGIIGNRGQANYAAGNTFQDELARYRVSKGLRAMSLDLSAVSDIGWIAEHSNMDTLLKGAAIQSMKQEEIFTVLQYACGSSDTPTANAIDTLGDDSNEDKSQVILGLQNAVGIRRKGLQKPTYMDYPLFSKISVDHSGTDDTSTGENHGESYATELSKCTSLGSAIKMVVDAMKLKLTELVSISLEDIDDGKTLSSYGLDSLVAIEFRYWLGEELGAEVAVLEIIGTRSIRSIAGTVAIGSKYTDLKAEEGQEEELGE